MRVGRFLVGGGRRAVGDPSFPRREGWKVWKLFPMWDGRDCLGLGEEGPSKCVFCDGAWGGGDLGSY